MLHTHHLRAVALPILFSACAASQPPVPLVGTAGDVAALAGEWTGDYTTRLPSDDAQTGRWSVQRK